MESKLVRFDDGVLTHDDTSYSLITFDVKWGSLSLHRLFDPAKLALFEMAKGGRLVTVTLFDDAGGAAPRLRLRDGKMIYRIGYTPGSKGITELIEVRGGIVEVVADGSSTSGAS